MFFLVSSHVRRFYPQSAWASIQRKSPGFLSGRGLSWKSETLRSQHAIVSAVVATDEIERGKPLSSQATTQILGAPVGWRLALKHPERIHALIVQNGNAYEEGLKEFWDPI